MCKSFSLNNNINTLLTFFLKPLPVEEQNGKILGYSISVIGYLDSEVVYWETHLVYDNDTSLHLQGMLLKNCRMYHIVTDHAFWIESIVMYHRISQKMCIT